MGAIERAKIKSELYELFRPYMNGQYVLGSYCPGPNKAGCFEHKDDWYVYRIDEGGDIVITGPFNDRDIIYAVALELGLAREFDAYKFSDSADDIYANCHYYNINDLP